MSEDNQQAPVAVIPPEEDRDAVPSPAAEDDSAKALSAEIANMPPEVRRTFQAFSAMFRMTTERPSNPLLSKFTPEHIDKYLDMIRSDDEHDYRIRTSNRWFYLAYFVIFIVALAAAVVYLLPRDKDFLDTLIRILIIAAGSLGAGYGLAKRNK